MRTSVTLDLREKFEKEMKGFVEALNIFLDGKGEMPVNNTEAIKVKYIGLSATDMMKTGTPRGVAQRVSKSCFEDLLENSLQTS